MALDQKKLQKKRAKKAAKRKAILAGKKTAQPGILAVGKRAMTLAATAPIHQCWMGEQMFTSGMGTVIISRVMPDGRIGTAFFLLDVYCLGVKNAYFLPMSRDQYKYRLDDLAFNETITPIQPAYARKLVEGAEAYARDLGFSPHSDYQLAKQIMNDINAAECSTQFTFGKDGQPFFIAGPHDTPKRIDKILATLNRRCGPNGFHYLLPLGGPLDFDDADFDDDDDDALEVEFTEEKDNESTESGKN
jgi:hypothetical protein